MGSTPTSGNAEGLSQYDPGSSSERKTLILTSDAVTDAPNGFTSLTFNRLDDDVIKSSGNMSDLLGPDIILGVEATTVTFGYNMEDTTVNMAEHCGFNMYIY